MEDLPTSGSSDSASPTSDATTAASTATAADDTTTAADTTKKSHPGGHPGGRLRHALHHPKQQRLPKPHLPHAVHRLHLPPLRFPFSREHRLDDKILVKHGTGNNVTNNNTNNNNDENNNNKSWILRNLLLRLADHRIFLFSSLLALILWACVCAYVAVEILQKQADEDADAASHNWLTWLDAAGDKLRLMGTLFAFALVFRFNKCYERWNQGRVVWGTLISTSADITRMASHWICDDLLATRFCRWVVVFAYASKALLRGNSLAHPDEEGAALIDRKMLTREELDEMEAQPGWQPQYCLDMLDAIWIAAHEPPHNGDILMFDSKHKVHSQLFRAIEGSITKLGASLGDAIRIRASGLPETYDSLHHLIFYAYFMLSAVFYAPSLGWALPLLIGVESFIIMLISVLGSELVQPFGSDRVDLPLELFCQTIEVQVRQIREPQKCQNMKRLAHTSDTILVDCWNDKDNAASASISRGIKGDHKKVSKEPRLSIVG